MRHPKTAYELSASQVYTPPGVVSLFWRLLHQRRRRFDRVLDMGAGDGRFAVGGRYARYDGIEIDPARAAIAKKNIPRNGRIFNRCAFEHAADQYDACIGNPPYVRHHDIEPPWKKRVLDRLHRDLDVELAGHGNLYLYFLLLGILKTHRTGIVGMVIPFEWVSRTSAASVRNHIEKAGWDVSVYRFRDPIFDDVMTTASISIIDKNTNAGKWSFYNVLPDLTIEERNGVSGSRLRILRHAPRGKIWGRRGMSPGSQKIFTLTEGERIHAGLKKWDVMPCVTSLRKVPRSLKELTKAAFEKHLVKAGRRCWLIKSNRKTISPRLKAYLDNIPEKMRQTWTCLNQEPWYDYETGIVPDLLFHSGFRGSSPKILVNSVGAYVVGSVYGIHCDKRVSVRRLREHLVEFDFGKRVVAHAKEMKKVEVKQVNGVLSDWLRKQSR